MAPKARELNKAVKNAKNEPVRTAMPKLECVLDEIGREVAAELGPVIDGFHCRYDEEIKALVKEFGMEAVVKSSMSRDEGWLHRHGVPYLWEGSISLHDIVGASLSGTGTKRNEHFSLFSANKRKRR